MLNKKENENMSRNIIKIAQEIAKLINANKEDLAFLVYKTNFDTYACLDLEDKYKEEIKDYLNKRVKSFNELFFMSFCGSFIDFKNGEISVAKLNDFSEYMD